MSSQPKSNPRPAISRRSFVRLLTRGLLLSGIGGGGAYSYGRLIERHRLEIERVEVKLAGLGTAFDGFRIVQISDLHLEPNYDSNLLRHCVETINGLKPDVIALTGDYVTSNSSRVMKLAAPLAGLKANAEIVACLGNHDVWTSASRISDAMKQHGITVLRNSGLGLSRNHETLWLAGLDSAWGGRPDVTKSLHGRKADSTVVMLAHEPDYADHVAPQISGALLQLSGHTHGGQVCLPGGFPLRLPSWGKKYAKGLFQVGKVQLYVNRGLGTIGPKARFACAPEITEITLRSA